MNGKRILLIVGGGIAAYKSCELVRLLRKEGASVRCVVTSGGQKFVTPMTLAAPSRTSSWWWHRRSQEGGEDVRCWVSLLAVAAPDLLK